MYRVTRNGMEITVTGSNQFEVKIDGNAVGVVVRQSLNFHEDLRSYAVQFSDMTNSELVAFALGTISYPV